MKFNYTSEFMNVRQSWFKRDGLFSKIGYKALYTYLNLFKFWIWNQEYEYTFTTTIDKLRKETGYTANDILEHLKLLKQCKVLKMLDLSRWDYLLSIDGKLDVNRMLTIAADIPTGLGELSDNEGTKNNDIYYTTVYLNTMKRYEEIGICEKGFGLYCLIKSLSAKNGFANMSISNMADSLGIDKDTVLRLVYKLNRNFLLYSQYEVQSKYTDKHGNEIKNQKFKHFLLYDADNGEREKIFLENRKRGIQANINRWDRKNKNKEIMKNENE